MDETWRNELAEFIAIPSVSADPAHRDDVKRAGEWVCDFIRRIGGTAELTPFGDKELALGEIRASSDPDNAPTVLCYGHFDVQPPAPLELWDTDPFDADDQGRVGVRARHHRRQGPGLHPAEGGAEARRGERAARQPALRLRRRGGGRRQHDRRLPRHRRSRRGRGHHLRRRHAPHRHAGVRPRDARADRIRRRREDGRARPALGHVRRSRAERRARADALLRGGARRPERAAAGAAPRRHRCADGRGAQLVGRASVRRRRARRRRVRGRSIQTRPDSSTSAPSRSRRPTSPASSAASRAFATRRCR